MSGRGHMGWSQSGDKDMKGGILVFFPSYGTMDSVVERWKKTDIYDYLITAGGAIIVEQKGSATPTTDATNKQDSNYPVKKPYSNINSFKGNGSMISNESNEDPEQQLQGIVGTFEATLKRLGKCILLAVCR